MSDSADSLLLTLRHALNSRRGTTGIVAISGGADSLALLHGLSMIAADLHIKVAAATFDHGLRGAASFDDAVFSAQTAGRWGVACAVGRGDLDPKLPGVEERARAARYAFLAECADDIHADWVATAHHADDQAETLLMNMIRGAGARGLGGMRAEAAVPGRPSLPLLRPLLMLRKSELEAYCHANEIRFREDPTNRDTRQRRSWIRHTVIPLFETINPAVVAALARLAATVAEEDALLEDWVDTWCDTHVRGGRERLWVRRSPLTQLAPALQRRSLLRLLKLIVSDCEPSFEHVNEVLRLLEHPEGGIVDVPGGVRAAVDSEYLCAQIPGSVWTPPGPGYWLPQRTVCELQTIVEPDFGWTIHRTEVDSGPSAAVLVLEVGGAKVVVRTRRAGDRVALTGGGHQKLKEWFINAKVPRLIRDHLPIIEVDGQIAATWDGYVWQKFTFEPGVKQEGRPNWLFVPAHPHASA